LDSGVRSKEVFCLQSGGFGIHPSNAPARPAGVEDFKPPYF